MTASGALTEEQHKNRAERHASVGDALAAAGEDDWAAVCYFYAAYHLVRAALVGDPVFDNPNDLARIDVELTPEDRYTQRHKGRKKTSNGREWGVNELVLLLYRPYAGIYDRLHQASIDVRYGRGFKTTAADARALYDQILAASDMGKLRA